MSKSLHAVAGAPLPLGVREVGDGYNFSLFSRHATNVRLVIYALPDSSAPLLSVDLDPRLHRDGDVWCIKVKGVSPGNAYSYRVSGPYEPGQGLRFNDRRTLVDPYAEAMARVSSCDFSRARSFDPEAGDARPAQDDNDAVALRGLIVDRAFDWMGDRPLRHPWSRTVIYEMHVRGLTMHPSSGVKHPGTFHGVTERIPYLKSLGVTAVELLPVHEFNENELARDNPCTGGTLRNYWGYSTVGFFAPKQTYAVQPGRQVQEFKEMVRELHAAGIEVILDVVFNHTAEGNELGPTLCFRGIDNPIYYQLEEDRRYYRNYSGCGNTVNCNHPVVRDFILDCLRYWASEMHVDGFRFDLASILGRDESGQVASDPPLLNRIAEDPVLRDVKLIAEAWDVGGAWQVGRFSGQRWSEWNCHFRDEVRRFWRGDPGMRGAFAARLCGSADLYQAGGKQPLNSINFVTCHDGFTLNDLVSYARKHNECNGEQNRDGSNDNWSGNGGVEGVTNDPEVEALRLRQVKNLLATLFLSRGVPMLLGGDEFRRTQGGNNNAYCQDNDLSWIDWRLAETNAGLVTFVAKLIAFRERHPVLTTEMFYDAQDITWFDTNGKTPEWGSAARTLGCQVHGERYGDVDLCLLFNADPQPMSFVLPQGFEYSAWRVAVDTGVSPPADACVDASHESADWSPLASSPVVLSARSVVVLVQSADSP